MSPDSVCNSICRMGVVTTEANQKDAVLFQESILFSITGTSLLKSLLSSVIQRNERSVLSAVIFNGDIRRREVGVKIQQASGIPPEPLEGILPLWRLRENLTDQPDNSVFFGASELMRDFAFERAKLSTMSFGEVSQEATGTRHTRQPYLRLLPARLTLDTAVFLTELIGPKLTETPRASCHRSFYTRQVTRMSAIHLKQSLRMPRKLRSAMRAWVCIWHSRRASVGALATAIFRVKTRPDHMSWKLKDDFTCWTYAVDKGEARPASITCLRAIVDTTSGRLDTRLTPVDLSAASCALKGLSITMIRHRMLLTSGAIRSALLWNAAPTCLVSELYQMLGRSESAA